MHPSKANKVLFISAPSYIVYLSISLISASPSDPAKSINDNFPAIKYFNF